MNSVRRTPRGPVLAGPLTDGVHDEGLLVLEAATGQAFGDRERPSLSPREREILGCLAHGDSNKEIARTLDLAESTVKIHVQNIFKKLGMTSRVQVALYAAEHGFGPAPRQT